VINGAAHLNPRHVGHFDGIGYWRGQRILRKNHRQASDDERAERAERNRSPRDLAPGRLAADHIGRFVVIHDASSGLAGARLALTTAIAGGKKYFAQLEFTQC